MKTKILLTVLALGLMISATGQRATIELTFTAENNGQWVPLDSILIENLTRNTDTTLYDPDTVLALVFQYVNIRDNESIGKNNLTVSQNYPNPFAVLTTINIYLPKKEKIEITIQDILGREVGYYENTLNMGNHKFTLCPGSEKLYLLTVTGEYASHSIKMLNANNNSKFGSQCKIVHTANDETKINFKDQKANNNFAFYPGDSLRYTGYATIDNTIIGSDIKTDEPITNMAYAFAILKGIRCSGDPTITDIDNNVYQTLKIGDQCWMAENLKTTKLSDGTEILRITDNTEWTNLITFAYCWYDNDFGYKNPYGALYNWYTVGAGNLCPTGWHVPTDEEWTILTDYLGGVDIAGTYLKEKGTMHWNTNTGATNETGFTAIGGGSRGALFGLFLYMGEYGYWWSSTVDVPNNYAWYRSLKHYTNAVSSFPTDKRNGFSVRCLRDD